MCINNCDAWPSVSRLHRTCLEGATDSPCILWKEPLSPAHCLYLFPLQPDLRRSDVVVLGRAPSLPSLPRALPLGQTPTRVEEPDRGRGSEHRPRVLTALREQGAKGSPCILTRASLPAAWLLSVGPFGGSGFLANLLFLRDGTAA